MVASLAPAAQALEEIKDVSLGGDSMVPVEPMVMDSIAWLSIGGGKTTAAMSYKALVESTTEATPVLDASLAAVGAIPLTEASAATPGVGD